jgi:hypothetical protein
MVRAAMPGGNCLVPDRVHQAACRPIVTLDRAIIEAVGVQVDLPGLRRWHTYKQSEQDRQGMLPPVMFHEVSFLLEVWGYGELQERLEGEARP